MYNLRILNRAFKCGRQRSDSSEDSLGRRGRIAYRLSDQILTNFIQKSLPSELLINAQKPARASGIVM